MMTSDRFPKFLSERLTGEAGVNAVSSIVNDKLKWIFRRVNAEHDFGIDGYIEIVTDDGNVTGQSIAVQIKSGGSFFKRKSPSGFSFYGENKHLNYYLNMNIPILIVLYDPKRRRCYWEQFDIRKTEPADSRWKMIVSSRNILSTDSKRKLLQIVGPTVEHTEAIQNHWALNSMLTSFDIILYAVDREDVETCNTLHLKEFVDRIFLNETLCRKLQGRIEISISGYDVDPRELWEIPEVIRWYQGADAAFQHWFFFLNTRPPAPGLRTYFVCLSDAKREASEKGEPGKVMVSIDPEKLSSLFETNFLRLNELTDRLGMSIEENKTISYAIFDVMHVPHGD